MFKKNSDVQWEGDTSRGVSKQHHKILCQYHAICQETISEVDKTKILAGYTDYLYLRR